MDERGSIATPPAKARKQGDDAGDGAAVGIVVAVFASVGALLGRQFALWAVIGLSVFGEVLAGLVGGVVAGLTGFAWMRFAAALSRKRVERGRRPRAEPATFVEPVPEAPSSAEESLAWLHVVSGPSGRRVSHAVAELAAHWLAKGERVVVVDGGPRLRLHAAFGARPTLGLLDCLANGMPILGLVQYAGARGFYLLVHGTAPRGRLWSELGRLLDGARTHFDRVVLALDMGTPYGVGQALAGRYLEAWWADPDPEHRAGARALSERLGIRFNGMQLEASSVAISEALTARVEALRPAGAPLPEPLPEATGAPVPEVSPGPPAPAAILECDLQVRERLRFLMWMRGVRNEARGGASLATSRRDVPQVRPLSGG